MKTIVRPIEPQPVLFDARPPGRWGWTPESPVLDLCADDTPAERRGVSWWNMDNGGPDILPERHCPIDRPKSAKVEIVFDGERWSWLVRFSEGKSRKR